MTVRPVRGLVLITGVTAAGKSTIAQMLAEQLPRSAHVRGDVFRRFVLSGRVDPTRSMPDEAGPQLTLRYRLAMTTGDAYVRAGYTAVVQDIIVGSVLADVVAISTTRPCHLVVLDPEPSAVMERNAGRPKTGYGTGWSRSLWWRRSGARRRGWGYGSTPPGKSPPTPSARSSRVCRKRPLTSRNHAMGHRRPGCVGRDDAGDGVR